MQGIKPKFTTYIDTHCHYYASISFADFFVYITKNISAYSKGASNHFAICLVEIAGTNWFSLLQTQVPSNSFSVETKDEQTLLVHSGDQLISVFCAHQVNSLEKVEVIIVGHRKSIPSGLPLVQYLEIYSDDYLVILPWGVGKWLGDRGRLISKVIQQNFSFALGDNGGRPGWWSSISQFSKAHELNIPVLAGSDPLPVKSFVNRVAGYGNIFDGEFSECHAWINAVKALTKPPKTFGHVCTTVTFIFDQISLRLNKFFKKG